MPTYQQDAKLFDIISKNSVKCKCSHTFVLGRRDRALCSHCGNWVYKTPELEFKYKLKEEIKKNGR